MRRLKPADVVGVDVHVGPVPVHHVGVVSRVDHTGIWVISNSKRIGRVAEERIEAFANGAEVTVHALKGRFRPEEVVRRARKHLGKPWGLWDNCEMFVRDVHGLRRESPQLAAGFVGAILVGVIATLAGVSATRG